MAEDAAMPTGIDSHIPNAARMYNYFLGGKDNFPTDREAAERVLTIAPEVRELARQNRAFLCRAVRHLVAEAGIRQFVDIGAGLPTQGNVHEVAAEVDPGTQVAYVDNDPVVLSHARALLSSTTNTVAVPGDLRDPEAILDDPELNSLIDFTEPVAILLVAVLHFISDSDKPDELIGRLRDAVPRGSYLVLSHATAEERSDIAHQAAEVYRDANMNVSLRSRERILGMFDGFELVEPGLVREDEWRPDQETLAGPAGRATPTWLLCGIGRSM